MRLGRGPWPPAAGDTLRGMRCARLVPTLICCASAAAPVLAADTPPSEWAGGAPFLEWTRLSGNWAGGRDRLADRGVTLDAKLTNEVSGVLATAVDDDSRRFGQRTLLTMGLGLDLERLAGLPKAQIGASWQYAGGDDAANRVGDAQGWSNINVGSDIHQLSELWYQQRLGTVGKTGDLLRVKAGKIDACSEFAYLPVLAGFLNSSAGVSPTILGIPTYPDPSMGFATFVQPLEGVVLAGGGFDAATTTLGHRTGPTGVAVGHGLGHDTFWIAQATGTWTAALPGQAEAGVWRLRGDVPALDGGSSDGATGWYAAAQQDVCHPGEGRSVTAMAQFGSANQAVSGITRHLASGLWLQGVCAKRLADGAGVYLTHARFSEAVDATSGDAFYDARGETALEAVYAFQATGWWRISLDAQWIRNPGGSTDPGRAWVQALRSDLTF